VKNYFKTVRLINATPKTVWQTLTDSDLVKQYMFGSMIESNWEIGSSITFYIEKDGERIDAVYGKIEKLEPHSSFRHTLYPPNAEYPNIPENHIYVEYTLKENNGKTELSIEQGGFETAADGEKRYTDVKNGWDVVLPSLTKVAEAHQ